MICARRQYQLRYRRTRLVCQNLVGAVGSKVQNASIASLIAWISCATTSFSLIVLASAENKIDLVKRPVCVGDVVEAFRQFGERADTWSGDLRQVLVLDGDTRAEEKLALVGEAFRRHLERLLASPAACDLASTSGAARGRSESRQHHHSQSSALCPRVAKSARGSQGMVSHP